VLRIISVSVVKQIDCKKRAIPLKLKFARIKKKHAYGETKLPSVIVIIRDDLAKILVCSIANAMIKA